MSRAAPQRNYAAAGTYGNTFDGFEATDSLPMPRRTGVFDAIENMTFRRVIREGTTVPFGEAERGHGADRVGEHVGEESMRDLFRIGSRVLGAPIGGNDTGDGFNDGFAVRREIIGRAPRVETVAQSGTSGLRRHRHRDRP